ncbi:hypothetical protein [Janthinobacterium sp.]|uniref:hypothetical protein n=1 Tax=Janthinobacterium sp. TaxID=1871054 RepID=UPI0026064093|nr:hypothetical protein [Janthinobacterium sp.]
MKVIAHDISRYLLRAGAALAVATACASKPGPWPARALPANAAVTVDATQFLSRKQLVDWQYDLDMAQYLARLPQDSLPRSVMLLLTGGHLAGGAGIAQFMDRHKDDGLTQRMAAMLGIGQLGALEVLPDSNGYLHLTGRSEPAALFSPRTPVLMEASYAMLRQAGVAPAFVLPPGNIGGDVGGDGSAQRVAWLDAGQTFRAAQRLPTLSYAKAPTYQFSYGIGTVTQADYRLMQRETVALTQMLLDLSRVPYADLRKETAP